MGASHSLDLREKRQNTVQVHQIDESSPSIRIMLGTRRQDLTGSDIMLQFFVSRVKLHKYTFFPIN